MNTLFYPKSIVVVGVSLKPMNLGRFIITNLIEFGYEGAIYMLGREKGYLFGHEIHTRVEDIPQDIDLGVFLVPAAVVVNTFEALAGQGMKRAVIQSGGFSELGKEGKVLEQRLLDIANTHNIRFVGPNCLGVISKHAKMAVPFVPFKDLWRTGDLSVISQSGGVGVSYLYRLVSENIGLSKFVSIGNKLDLDEVDYLKYLDQDNDTRHIVMYLESFNRGREFYETLKKTKKPVIIQKANRTELARGIAYSHTVSLATDEHIGEAALNQGGAMIANSMEDVIALVKTLSLPKAKNRKVAIIARSGGHAVIAADAAADAGFELVDFPDAFLQSIENAFENNVISRQNPLDLGDVYDFDTYARIMREACKIREAGAVVMIHEYFSMLEAQQSRKLVEKANELANLYDKPVVLIMFTDDKELAMVKQAYNYPIFTSISRAFSSLARVRDHVSNEDNHIVRMTTGFDKVPVIDTFDMLRSKGLDVPIGQIITTTNEIDFLQLNYPVAVKVMSPSVIHKTDVGAVKLGINNKDELRTVVQTFVNRFNPGPGEGIFIQEQISGIVEAVIGGVRDPSFGPVITVGLGGVMVELFKDVRFLLAPLSPGEVRRAIESLISFPMFTGFRGKMPADVDAFLNLVVKVANLFVNSPNLKDFDLNPVIIGPKDVHIIDARFDWAV